MRMTLQTGKVLAGVWQSFLAKRQDGFLAKRQDDRERKRIEYADRMRHAMTVLEALRSSRREESKGQA